MANRAQACIAKATPDRSSWPACAGNDDPAAEFLSDLAERVAALCVRMRPQDDQPAVPLARPCDPLDSYCHIQPIGRCAAQDCSGVAIYQADGNLRSLDEIQADVIRIAIRHYQGRMSEVARRLDIGRSTLYRKLDEYGIDIAR